MIAKLKEITFKIKGIIHPNFTEGFFYVSFLGLVMALMDLVGISLMFYVIGLILGFAEGTQIPILSAIISSEIPTNSLLLVSVIVMFLLYLIKNFLVIIFNRMQLNFAFHVGAKVSKKRYENIINKQTTYFSKEKSTDIINEVIGAGVLLPENIIIPTIVWVSEVLLIFLVGIALAIYNIYLFLFLLLIFAPTILVIFYVNQLKVKNIGRNIHRQMPNLYDNLLQLNRGIEVIKLWNIESHFSKIFQEARDVLYSNKKELQLRLHFIPVRVFEMVVLFGIVALVVYAYFTETSSDIVNIMAVYAAVAFKILPSVNRVVGSTNQIISHQYVFDHFEDFNFDEEVVESIVAPVDFKKNIQLREIYFQYESNKKCIENLSLDINSGEIIGIQGKNGEGKTTLLKIICGIIDPDQGEIFIDNIVLTPEKKRSFHHLFSYVSQEVFLILGSVRDNLQFYKKTGNQKNEDEKMIKILHRVGLKDWFEKLPNGLDSQIGEWGKTLSGGQKQKLAIARAIYKDTQVFICDEMTSGLDADSVLQVLQLLQDLAKSGKTIVISSHIASDLDICHKIFQLTSNQMLKSN